MDWQSQQPDPEPDPLDHLLAEARWAEPMPRTIRRLRGQWQSLVARRSRRHRWAIAAAASVGLAGLTFWTLARRETLEPQPTGIAARSLPPPVPPEAKPSGGSRGAGSVVDVPAAASPTPDRRSPNSRLAGEASRGPNPYDLMVLAAHRRTHAERQRRAAARPSGVDAGQQQPVDRAVEQVAAQPELPHSASAPDGRAEMVVAQARRSDCRALGRLVRNEPDPAVRRELLSMLLSRGDRRSVQAFLGNVDDRRTWAEALDCLSLVPSPPISTLIQCLRGPQAADRMAAAQVLGRLNRTEVSRELIAMIGRGQYRQEAMIALLASSETTAQEFLAKAARDPMLSATLWNAQRQSQSSSLFFGGHEHAMSHQSG